MRLAARRDRDDVVPRVVERRAHELAHRGVDHREAPRLVALQVFDARHEHARWTGDRAARLEHHGEARGPEAAGEALAVGARVHRLLVAIADAEAAAQVEVLERQALGGEP